MPSSSCATSRRASSMLAVRAADDDGAARLGRVHEQRACHRLQHQLQITSSTGVTSTQVTTTRREKSSENLVT